MTEKTSAIVPSMFNEHLFRDHFQYYQISEVRKTIAKMNQNLTRLEFDSIRFFDSTRSLDLPQKCELYITSDTYRKIDIARARDICLRATPWCHKKCEPKSK